MDRDALAWINANTESFREIEDAESESILIARPVDVAVQSLEQFQRRPNRIQQKVILLSTQSFIDYVNRFWEADTTIYMNVKGRAFLAVLDHYGKENPSWKDHAAKFSPEASLEWLAWHSVVGSPMTQNALANFIEAQLNDIVVPEPNVMLQAALAFEANENMTLASSINLDNGNTKFNFVKENVNASVTFPHRIQIHIPLIENEARETLELRIRYRADSDGVLTFTISFVTDPAMIIRNAMVNIADLIKDGVEEVQIYEGSTEIQRR